MIRYFPQKYFSTDENLATSPFRENGIHFNPITYPELNVYHYTVPIMESVAAPARTQKALK
jgi:hypothetical protein